jgi:homodimeric-type pyruvate dehydrogenase E1 component
MAMVVRAARRGGELGGHIASFASAATLYDVGFNHFFKGPDHADGSDLVFIQGHSSPGIYARAFLEGRMSEEQLDGFRQEVDGEGISSYPHPWLMPEFWQFPTVSMGLGPIMSIYQARFLKYLTNRGITDAGKRKVWSFLGDGEMDEPESLGAISLAGREKLDNLVFVVNCNLQRLDGPVRGNGKIIQELEGVFRGAGWNVIKVVWGSYWDPLLARDTKGLLEGAWKRRSTVIIRSTRPTTAPTCASISSALRRIEGNGCRPVRRGHLAAQSRRPRSAQDSRCLSGRNASRGPADGHPGQDHQGLRTGPVGRGPEYFAPAEEAR